MNNEEILGEIAYLDADLNEKSAVFSSGEILALVRDAIQIEMAKQGHPRKTEDIAAQVASLEKRMEAMRREFIRQRGTPSVIYVRRQNAVTAPVYKQPILTDPHAGPKLPKAMIAFYALGLGCSLVFATLLALSGMKVETIHPFLSLLGLIGGLGWLTTAWTDLLLWKRENQSATDAATSETRAVSSSSAR